MNTMNTGKHTPIPWEVIHRLIGTVNVCSEQFQGQEQGDAVASVYHSGGFDYEDAALIVRVVNSFDALLETLRDLCNAARERFEPEDPYNAILEQASAVLDRAEGRAA